MKVIFQTIGVVLLLIYLAVCGFIWRSGEAPMTYRSVKVVITDSLVAQFIEEKDVLDVLRHDNFNPIGKNVSLFDTHALQNELKRNTLIRIAWCYATPDSTLRIDIGQRHPVMRIKSSRLKGGDYYLDTEGQLMVFKPSRKPVKVPLATGYVTTDFAQTSLYELSQFLQANRLWLDDITQIYVDEHQDIRLIPRVGNHVILLGSVENLDTKFDNLRLFYDKVLNHKGWNGYRTINLKFKGQVIAEK